MFPDTTERSNGTGVVVSAEPLEDLEHSRDLTEAAISDRTRAAYEYEFGRFARWAERHNLASLPPALAIVRAAIKHHHITLPPRAKGRNLDLATPEIMRLFQGWGVAAVEIAWRVRHLGFLCRYLEIRSAGQSGAGSPRGAGDARCRVINEQYRQRACRSSFVGQVSNWQTSARHEDEQ